MTGLRDPFDNVMRREGKFDYVPWSSIADRLDDVAPGWSFAIMGIGPDWVHGRLLIGGQSFENIGYAENATADWAKEVLKHAATDAFKRCAALAGVARYLYDKDADHGSSNSSGGRAALSPVRPPARSTTALPPDPLPGRGGPLEPIEPEEPEWFAPIGGKNAPASIPTDMCPIHDERWRGDPGDLYHGPKGVVEGGYCRHPDNVKKARAR